MVKEGRHIIEKVSVDVNVTSMETAEKVKSEINDFIQNEVLSIVESYFSNLSLSPELDDKVIQMDKVSLSIDTSSWNIHSKLLKQEIQAEVEKQMAPVIEKAKEKGALKTGVIPNGQEKFIDQGLNVYGEEERLLKSLFHFLEHGTLPWWVNSKKESGSLFSEELLLDALLSNGNLVLREMEKNANSQTFSDRLIRQFPSSVVTAFISMRVSNKAVEKRVFSASQEMETLTNELTKKVFALLWQLTNVNSKTEIYKKAAKSLIFEHVHSQFFQNKRAKVELNHALRTTHTALRFLYIAADRENELTKMSSEFLSALNEELPSEILNPLRSTKTYKELPAQTGENVSQGSEQSVNGAPAKSSGTTSESTLESSKIADVNSTSNDRLNTESSGKEKDEVINASADLNEDVNLSQKNTLESNETKTANKDSSADDQLELTESGIDESSKQDDRVNEESTQFEIQKTPEDQLAEKKKSKSEKELSEENKSNEAENSLRNPSSKTSADGEAGAKENQQGSDIEAERDRRESTGEQDKQTGKKSEADPKKMLKSERESESSSTIDKKQKDGNKVEDSTNNQTEMESNDTPALRKVLDSITNDPTTKRKKTDDVMPEYMFVNNAGLVLLNPFLPALFKQLELLSDSGKLTDPELAALVLHYAATGREGDFEFEMSFEKYLCGIPPTVSLNRDRTLSEAQKEEVHKVLNSVLTHWRVMKDKPIALLQNEFLTRPGKLITEKANHRLVIERKTFDLLLDKLPWSYSMIKFSWKNELIFVEW